MAQLIIKPEMYGKIVDESHFDFHVTCKAKMINAVNKLKSGKDFLTSLSHLNFKTDKRWTQNTCKDPSVNALLEILAEYKRVEKRPSRAKVLIPLLEYAIGLYASDLFFKERGAWFITQILNRRSDFEICYIPQFANPDYWYPNTRNSGDVQGKEGNFYKMENDPDNPQIIEDEYKKWYGVDVNGSELDRIPRENREAAIKAGQEYMKNSG
jgi:hypothetical protein